MAGPKDKDRFIFFKYVPPKKGNKPAKDEEYSKKTKAEASQDEGLGLSDQGIMHPPGFPICPDEPECPEYPGIPEYPGLPEMPECPECPEMPEFPEFPGAPEMPEYPECPLPEYPELPELPEPELPVPPEVPAGPCPENAVMHVILAGDTFWKLAKRYGTTVEAIEAANPNIDPLNLQIGETICVPTGIPGAKG